MRDTKFGGNFSADPKKGNVDRGFNISAGWESSYPTFPLDPLIENIMDRGNSS